MRALMYIIRRLIMFVPTLIGITLIVFALVAMLPSNRRAMLYIRDPRGPPVSFSEIQDIIEKMGLDQPTYVQFAFWIRELLRGNLGWSETAYEPVLQAILARLPATLELVLYSTPFVLLGIYFGVQASKNQRKMLKQLSRAVSIIGRAFPSFWLGMLLLVVLGWTSGRYDDWVKPMIVIGPSWRWYTGMLTIDALLNGQLWIFIDALKHLVLPVTVLTITNLAILLRALRNRPILTKTINPDRKRFSGEILLMALMLLGLLTTSILPTIILTEAVFKFPGVGYFISQAALRLDITPVISFLLLSSFTLATANLIADITSALSTSSEDTFLLKHNRV